MIRSLHRHCALPLACLRCLSPPAIISYPAISNRLPLQPLSFASLSYTPRLYLLAAPSPVFLPLAIAVCSLPRQNQRLRCTTPLFSCPYTPFKLVRFFLVTCIAFGRISPSPAPSPSFVLPTRTLNIVVRGPVRSLGRRAALHCLSLLRVCSSVSFRSLRR